MGLTLLFPGITTRGSTSIGGGVVSMLKDGKEEGFPEC